MTSKFWLWMILSFFLVCATTAEQNSSVYNETDSANLLEEVQCTFEKVKHCFHDGWEETYLTFVDGLSFHFDDAERLKFLDKCTSEKIHTYCFKVNDVSIRGYIEPSYTYEKVIESMFYGKMAKCFKSEGWNVTSPIVKKIHFECAKELMKYNIQIISYHSPPPGIYDYELDEAKEAYFKRYNEEFVETEISIESRAYSNMFNVFTIFWFVVVSFML
uniref:Uncharacterized protein n=1 Tax=Panagrolaimus sp. PS1159 TaxID=55785 RepID=A0AC35F261_9BILA